MYFLYVNDNDTERNRIVFKKMYSSLSKGIHVYCGNMERFRDIYKIYHANFYKYIHMIHHVLIQEFKKNNMNSFLMYNNVLILITLVYIEDLKTINEDNFNNIEFFLNALMLDGLNHDRGYGVFTPNLKRYGLSNLKYDNLDMFEPLSFSVMFNKRVIKNNDEESEESLCDQSTNDCKTNESNTTNESESLNNNLQTIMYNPMMALVSNIQVSPAFFLEYNLNIEKIKNMDKVIKLLDDQNKEKSNQIQNLNNQIKELKMELDYFRNNRFNYVNQQFKYNTFDAYQFSNSIMNLLDE